MIRDILDYQGYVIGQLELPDDTPEEVWTERLAAFSHVPVEIPPFIYPSFAVDKGPGDGVDQVISDDSWTEVSAEQVLWDKNLDYDIETNNFNVHWKGVYSHDSQLMIKDCVNVSKVELAIFKREEPEDDYWFILDKKSIDSSNEVQINGATSFNFDQGESYVLKIKLYKADAGLDCSATISGSDDYTAWGFNYIRDLD